MELRILKLSGLKAFMDELEHNQAPVLPLSPARLKSQLCNPDAEEDDPALVVAIRKNIIGGFCGILPGKYRDLKGNSHKIYWNSGWWVHPEWGKGMAIPLLVKFLKCTDQKVIHKDMSPGSYRVIKSLGKLVPGPMQKGYGAYLKLPGTRIPPVLNNSIGMLRKIQLKSLYHLKNTKISVHPVGPDLEIAHFISRNPFRSPESLEWALQNPWIGTEESFRCAAYPFSGRVNKTQYFLIYIEQNQKLVVELLIHQVNRQAHVLYTLTDIQVLPSGLCNLVLARLINEGVHQLKWIDPALAAGAGILNALKPLSYPSFLGKNMPQLIQEDFPQWGDGDVIAT